MSALIEALDNYTPLQYGENGHIEYGWSNQLQEKIVQFFFQLVRTDSEKTTELSGVLYDILTTIKNQQDSREYLKLMFCLLLQTRDITGGKGEYALSYMMLYTFHKVYPTLASRALQLFVVAAAEEDEKAHPYGSWKDMKYVAEYCYARDKKHPLIAECIKLINDQLTHDLQSVSPPSLCAKWVPRETSKYNWFFKLLARDWMRRIGNSGASEKKAHMTYRKIISGLNKKIDTVQIKQCGKKWADIDHNKTTSITLLKNKRAFLNIKKKGEQRSEDPDRITCAENFKTYITSRVADPNKEIKGKRIGLEKFTETALELLRGDMDKIECDMLNSQWRDSSSQTGALGKMIAMVDTSNSMYGSPLHCAIALGIRVAEKSLLGKRVLTFSYSPQWHNLEKCETFIDAVDSLKHAEWGGNTNFYAAYKLILNALKEKNVPREEVRDIVLVVFSDMQMDQADNTYNTLYKEIEQEFAAAGYQIPHILFWNLRSTGGFPTLSTQKNASMLSGYSPALLNSFCENGIDALKDIRPWNMFIQTVQKYFAVFDSAIL